MADGAAFPMFISAEYVRDGDGFAEFERAADSSAERMRRSLDSAFAGASASAKRQFQDAFTEISGLARNALAIPRNAGGSLDLNIKGYQEAATAARAQATALREIATAASRAQRANGDLSEETRRYVQAAGAAAREAETVARGAEQQATAMGRLQRELNETASATTAVVRQQGRFRDGLFGGTDGLRAQRLAMVQTGQQLQDFTVSLSSGSAISTVLVQQLPQLAFAMQGFGGKVGKVAEVLSGPLGFGLISVIALLAEFGPALFGAGDASDHLAERQRLLADYLDHTTGKIKDQINWLDILQGKRDLENRKEDQQKSFDEANTRFANAFSQGIAPTAPGERGFQIAVPSTVSQAGVALLRKTYLDLERGAIDAGKAVAIVNAAAAKDASLRDAAKSIETVSFSYNKAKKELDGTNLQLARLAVAQGTATAAQKKLVDQNRAANTNTARSIELQSQLATATTAVERARAQLEIIKLKGADIDKKGAAAQKEYRRELDEANKALNRAEAAEKAAREARTAGKRAVTEATQLANAQAAAEERIAKIKSRYDAQPRFVDQQQADKRYLDELIATYGKLSDARSKALVSAARGGLEAIDTGQLTRFKQFVEDQEQALQVQRLRTAGYDAEADALETIVQLQERIGALSEAQKEQILAIARARQQEREAAEDMQRIIQDYVGLVGVAQSAFERLLGRTASLKNPFKSVGGFATDMFSGFIQTNIRVLSDKLFSGMERELANFANPQHRLNVETLAAADSVQTFAKSLAAASATVNGLAVQNGGSPLSGALGIKANSTVTTLGEKSAIGLQSIISDALTNDFVTLNGSVANDNGEIIVTAKKQLQAQQETIDAIKRVAPSVGSALDRVNSRLGLPGVFDPIQKGMAEVLDPLAAPIRTLTKSISQFLQDSGAGGVIGSALAGAGLGILGAGLVGGNDSGSKIGGAIGGVLGKEAGKLIGPAIAKSIGGNLGKMLGGAAGPLGAIAGGIIGSLAGGLFSSTKKGSATLGYDVSTGQFTSSLSGNSASRKQAADQSGDSVTQSLQKIADAFGGALGAFSVSIGVRKESYRVDPTGQGRTKGAGVLDFGKDATAAIKAAIIDAVRDGAVQGLRAGTQRLIANNDDLDVGIDKASKFQGVFDTLQQTLDPVGFAIQQLDRQFEGLKRVFKEAGATSEEYADLEKLYSLQRAEAIKQAAQTMSSALKGLLDDLKTGEGGGLSLRDRLNNALAAYNPLASRVAAGDSTVDYQEFADAARTVQDLARQLYGSQEGFFDIVDGIRALTEQALADQQALIDVATGKVTPFDAAAPGSTATNDNAPIVSGLSAVEQAIAAQTGLTGAKLDAILAAIRSNVLSTVAQTGNPFLARQGGF